MGSLWLGSQLTTLVHLAWKKINCASFCSGLFFPFLPICDISSHFSPFLPIFPHFSPRISPSFFSSVISPSQESLARGRPGGRRRDGAGLQLRSADHRLPPRGARQDVVGSAAAPGNSPGEVGFCRAKARHAMKYGWFVCLCGDIYIYIYIIYT